MAECAHGYFRDVESCVICELEEERDEARRERDLARKTREGAIAVAEQALRDKDEARRVARGLFRYNVLHGLPEAWWLKTYPWLKEKNG